MIERKRCLSSLCGKSYGSNPFTLRTAYIGYIRSVWEYAAAVWMNYAAPATRAKVESQQNHCARIITGCLCNSKGEKVVAEARLFPLSLRAKELAARERTRIQKLPADNPVKSLVMAAVKPRLKYRAREAWTRALRNDPLAQPPDDDCVLEFKPSFRRIAEWIELESGLQNNLVDTHTTWLLPWQETSGIQITAKPPNMPKRTEAPELRKQRALEATDKYQTDVTVWTDGSVQENQQNGGAGIFLIDNLQNTSHDMKQPAGAICSSTRAELVAIETALSNLPESYKNLVLYTDSIAALQTLQKGPTRQTTSVGTCIWENLVEIRNHGRTVCLHWVPGHADLDGNEHADTLANEASEMAQEEVPLNFACFKIAVRFFITTQWSSRESRLPDSIGIDECNRWERCTISQLRVGSSSLTNDTLFKFGKCNSLICEGCETEED